jgi:hypothetical protein
VKPLVIGWPSFINYSAFHLNSNWSGLTFKISLIFLPVIELISVIISTIVLATRDSALNIETFEQKDIGISDLNSGVYFVRITTEKGTTIKKIVKL